MPIGVGIVGAGPGASALHLPTLARLDDVFEVVHVADAGSGRAAALARRSDARDSSGVDELLGDDRVEVVVLCSPPTEHAAQILSAVAAGKRAVLCEKPLATTLEDAEAVIAACRDAGVALMVGTNHFYDAAWGRLRHHLTSGGRAVRAVAVTVALPPNGRYHDIVTELAVPAVAPARTAPDLTVPPIAAAVVRQLVTGLAVHDLPLLRDLAPRIEEVVFARAVAPLGYAIGYRASGIPLRLATVMLPEGAEALWRVHVTTEADRIEVCFPPAFVHAGSATVTVTSADGRATTFPVDPQDGYLAEWQAMAEILDGTGVVEYDELLEDARYALTLADGAAARILEGAGA